MKSSHPNILVFMTDDHAQWALSCYGNSDIRTPNMDFLAETGIRFQNAFTPSPVCSPARACFFTGRLPSQHGIHDWISEKDDMEKSWLGEEKNIAELLKTSGYETALFGKWHCGQSQRPQRGFDHWFSYATGHQYPHYGSQLFSNQGRPEKWEGGQSERFANEACAFIRNRNREKPFFIFVGLVDTHSPFAGHPEPIASRYRSSSFKDIPLETPSPHFAKVRFGVSQTESGRRESLSQYYAAVTSVDEKVGGILDTLKKESLLDETLVVYTSDHGHMNGHHGLYTKGNATIPQNFYEESIRVPLLLRFPKEIPPGKVENRPVDHLDLFQTLLDFGGATAPKTVSYPGRSFRRLLKINSEWRDKQFAEYGNARMVRTPRFKYIQRYPPHAGFPHELYDLEQDPRETKNLQTDPAFETVKGDLAKALERHFARYESREKSGKRVLDLPSHNGEEPWRFSVL